MYDTDTDYVKRWLVGGLVFGCLLTAVVFVFVFKRCCEAYHKRHYRKLDYLVNGMYK